MPFTIGQFGTISPFLFHLTYASNVPRILRLRKLESAASLLSEGGQQHWIRQKRLKPVHLIIDSERICVTDQSPLVESNIEFQGGWTIADLIECLNRRVFFWRGPKGGLLAKDRGHHERYSSSGFDLVFLRIPFAEVAALNEGRGPEFCKYNSGAARQNDGKPIPRGSQTFLPAVMANFGIGQVREVCFRDFVLLPPSVEFSVEGWNGPWKGLPNN